MEAQLTRTSGLSLRALRLVDFVGDQFLARAGLTQNEHRGFRGRDQVNLADDVP